MLRVPHFKSSISFFLPIVPYNPFAVLILSFVEKEVVQLRASAAEGWERKRKAHSYLDREWIDTWLVPVLATGRDDASQHHTKCALYLALFELAVLSWSNPHASTIAIISKGRTEQGADCGHDARSQGCCTGERWKGQHDEHDAMC